MPGPLSVQVSGPLAPFKEGLATELERSSYLPIGASFQLQLMTHASRWLQENGLDAGALSVDVTAEFLAARRLAGYTALLTGRGMVRCWATCADSVSRLAHRRLARTRPRSCCLSVSVST